MVKTTVGRDARGMDIPCVVPSNGGTNKIELHDFPFAGCLDSVSQLSTSLPCISTAVGIFKIQQTLITCRAIYQ